MTIVQFIVNDTQRDEITALMVVDNVAMGEEIRRSIAARFTPKRLGLHSK